jgi:isocitrate dehydrogenase (NAD+)
VRLREEFNLYANLRPVKTIVPGRYDNIDIVLVRENIGGFYVAHDYYIPVGDDPRAVAVSTGTNTRDGCRRIARFAFDYAVKNGRRKITVVHKANVLKVLTGIFLEAAKEVGSEYEGRVAVDDRIVDACAMQLVLNPWQFDMLLCTNLFGDILSDLLAGLVGGLGLAPGANLGNDAAIFEAVHGSAPDIAGKGVANPISLLLAAGMMLDHVGKPELATRIRTAISETLNVDQIRTGDLKGKATTKEFTAALVQRLGKGLFTLRMPDAWPRERPRARRASQPRLAAWARRATLRAVVLEATRRERVWKGAVRRCAPSEGSSLSVVARLALRLSRPVRTGIRSVNRP